MLRYKCLVLDHDDTVVQTERHIGFPYFKKYLDEIRPGNQLTFAQYLHDCSGVVFSDMCKKCWNMTDEECAREYQGWKEYYTNTPHAIFPGMERIIKRQKEAGGLVCVATLSPKEDILRDYKMHFDIEPDAIYDHDMPAAMRKPNPFPLTDIMEKFRLRPEEILVVDDLKLGWQMAQPVKADVAYAAWSKVEFPELRREMEQLCQYSFIRVEDLEAFLFGEV